MEGSAPDVLVVGGGLLGWATAYQLARRGRQVLVVDDRKPGRATDAGAGILAPAVAMWPQPGLYEFAMAAMTYYPRLISQLAEDGQPDTGYDPSRILVVAGSNEERDAYRELRNRVLDRNPELVDEVSSSEARDAFPALAEVHGAMLSEAAARVDGRKLTTALATASMAGGVQALEASVTSLQPAARSVRVGLADGRWLDPAVVVLAAGAWTPALAEPLGFQLPVAPQRGQIVHLGVRDDTSGWAIVEGFRGHYILPWPDGRIVCGATRETGSGYAPSLTVAGQSEVLFEALRLGPGLADASVLEWRVGLRPLSGTGRPWVGALDGFGRVYTATGHGPNGLLLGPYSGYLLSQAITTGRPVPELAPVLPA